jgi:hypothetical protein
MSAVLERLRTAAQAHDGDLIDPVVLAGPDQAEQNSATEE